MRDSSLDRPDRVDQWFAEHTYRWQQFRDVRRLVRLKDSQSLRVSVVLPTLNEAPTLARVIGAIKTSLVDRGGLVDELVVVDSGSTDGTAEIARALGVPVVRHADVLTSAGSVTGKGEALWKSLCVLSGDIVAWCDTDIATVSEGFILGVVGPLLDSLRLAYVKGFYRRPIVTPGGRATEDGGRVTELVARPLISLLHPGLSGFVQPLAGVCAARRELLERLPFFAGYGVEIGHLIDCVEMVGLDGIAQTGLGTVVHRNRGLHDLSRMAFAIEHVMLQRFLRRHGAGAAEALQPTLRLVRWRSARDRAGLLERWQAADVERPPMITMREYASLRGGYTSGAGRAARPGPPASLA